MVGHTCAGCEDSTSTSAEIWQSTRNKVWRTESSEHEPFADALDFPRSLSFPRLQKVSTDTIWTNVPNSRAGVNFLKQLEQTSFTVATTFCLGLEQQLHFPFEHLLDAQI